MANETILVVDGDTRSRKILEVSFKKSGYRVLMTDTIAGAVEYLEEETPDLIVSDTDLPDGDGFEFCRRIKENPDWEYTPFLFLTDESSLPRKIKGIEIGADDYLTRPIYIKEVTTRVEVLLKKRDRELLSEGEVEEFRGELSEITLIDLMQTIDEESRSGVVEFWRDERNGAITFREGEIIDASCGKLRGPEAVYRLMLWPGGKFWVRYHEDVPGSDHIGMSTEELLLEGVRRIERWDEIAADLPPLDRVYEPDYEKLPGFLDAVPEQVGRVVRLFDGFRSLREVVDDSPVGDVTAAEIIHRVFEEGILEEVEEAEGDEGSAATGRSHLSSWLDDSGEEAEPEGFREEDTSPGYPASPQSGDPHETQEIERDDLTTALSDQLDEEEDGEAASESSEPIEERELDPNESGPRYMPNEREDAKLAYTEGESEGGELEPVDETLDELEEAERKRRKEEAKRLVEQKQQPAPAGETDRVETSGGGDDAPRIPGATKTREGAEASSPETSAPKPEREVSETTQSGDWKNRSEEKSAEGTPRGRTSTPRAHPTAEQDGGSASGSETDGGRSRKETQGGIGETGLEQEKETGVPVSFETVGDEEGEEPTSQREERAGAEPAAQPGEPEEPEASEQEESGGQTMTEEAAEAVRQSARQALEEAALDAEDWTDEDAEAGDAASTTADGGREREETAPYGDRGSMLDRESSPEETSEPEAGGAEAEASPARPPESDQEAADELEAAEPEAEPPEDIERVSNNGEVVRAEYDLSGPEGEQEEESPSGETLEGVSRKPEPADETIESDETLEGVAPEREDEEESEAESDVETAPSDETLDGFSGVSGEVKLEDEAEAAEAEEEAPALEPSGGDQEEGTDEGLDWDEEPTARDFGWASEGAESVEAESDESSEEPSTEETDEEEDSGTPPVRIESEAFATSGTSDAEGGEQTDAASGLAEDEAARWDEATEAAESAAREAESSESPGSKTEDEASEAPPSTPEQADAKREAVTAPSDETPRAPSDETPEVAEGDEEDLEDLTSSTDEASFFEEDDDEEPEWAYDEEVEGGDGGGTWTVVTIGLVIAGIAGVAFILGPFSGGDESESAEEGESEPVAKSDEPEPEQDEEAEQAASDEKDEESTGAAVGPALTLESKEEAESFFEETAVAVRDRAERTSRILAGEDPYLSSPSADAGDVGVEEDAGTAQPEEQVAAQSEGSSEPDESAGGAGTPASASSSSGSSGGGGGGGVAAKISQARSQIQSGRLSEAHSTLRELKREAPGRSQVAKLFLQLGTAYQQNENRSQAESAYRSFLDLQPEGARAEEVRSILDRW